MASKKSTSFNSYLVLMSLQATLWYVSRKSSSPLLQNAQLRKILVSHFIVFVCVATIFAISISEVIWPSPIALHPLQFSMRYFAMPSGLYLAHVTCSRRKAFKILRAVVAASISEDVCARCHYCLHGLLSCPECGHRHNIYSVASNNP